MKMMYRAPPYVIFLVAYCLYHLKGEFYEKKEIFFIRFCNYAPSYDTVLE